MFMFHIEIGKMNFVQYATDLSLNNNCEFCNIMV